MNEQKRFGDKYQKKRKDCGQVGNGTDASTGTGDA